MYPKLIKYYVAHYGIYDDISTVMHYEYYNNHSYDYILVYIIYYTPLFILLLLCTMYIYMCVTCFANSVAYIHIHHELHTLRYIPTYLILCTAMYILIRVMLYMLLVHNKIMTDVLALRILRHRIWYVVYDISWYVSDI